MKVGVVGGGMTGLALAWQLARQGHRVSVLERDVQIGGLATWFDYGAFLWDRFYHVILPTDVHLIRFIGDLGLAQSLRWKHTLTGFYVDRQFHSMSSSLDFLRFPPIGLLAKVRLAATVLHCARIKDWRRLERIPVGPWLQRLSGKPTYEKLWKPLLLAKLGNNYERVSAVFIWSYITRMFSARSGSARKEHLGHVVGGYRTVFTRLHQLIESAGGFIRSGVTVERIAALPGGGMAVRCDGQEDVFDKVIFTGPTDVLRRVAAMDLFHLEDPGLQVEYLGVICMVLITRKPLTPFYIVNIADDRIPFTGVIGMSNVVDPQETAGLHITFFPKYVNSSSPLLKWSNEALKEWFLPGVRLMFPEVDDCIESVHINRASRVQPLQVLDYSRLVPRVASAHADFFVLNTAQFTHATLNNNEVIHAVDVFMERFGSRFACGHSRPCAPDWRPADGSSVEPCAADLR